MTATIVAMLYFRGNFRIACQFLSEYGYISQMLNRSRFNRRLFRIANLFLTLFLSLGEYRKQLNARSSYVLDSYPIAACDNFCIRCCKPPFVRWWEEQAPKSIHAITANGFDLKVALFVLAASINFLW